MLLQELVQIPSVNPDHASPEQADLAGEQRMADFLKIWLEDIGAQVILEEIEPGRPNLIARFAPLDGRPRILLGPHLDTVGIDNMTIPPFSGEIRDGKIWGRGASDTKGPMAAMLMGLKNNKEILKDLPVAVDFVAFMGEEASQHGSKHFAKHHAAEYEFAIVGEPTDCKVVNTHKGSLWVDVMTTGKAVHGATPERGVNAILKMMPVLQRLSTEFKEGIAAPAYRHPVLGDSTINFGTITGGTRKNIVAEHCNLSLDIRYTPAWRDQGMWGFLQEFLAGEDVILRSFGECGPLDTDPEHPLVRELAGVGNGLAGAPWFCDAAWLAAGGIPSVAAGPGKIDQAHTCDEFISVADLEEGVGFYRRFLERL